MKIIDSTTLLRNMQSMSNQAAGKPEAADSPTSSGFAALLRYSIEQTNTSQLKAGQLAKAYQLGSQDIQLAEVMVAMQKANLSFSAITEVRNRLVSAYQNIMNMQV
ncbi:MAG TPA: flagellar hook-basal body complex protein FliE [Gammaproteobacteria bacterium]|nr:flagellar hook-basal body complex protein FliE [Gammaproteobacteria bacterium]